MHPPWILYPGELPFSSQYSQGNGESCLLHVWLPFWLTCQPRRRRSIFATGMPRKNGRLIVGQRKNENSGGNPVVAHHVPRQNYSGACRRRLRYGRALWGFWPRRSQAKSGPTRPTRKAGNVGIGELIWDDMSVLPVGFGCVALAHDRFSHGESGS